MGAHTFSESAEATVTRVDDPEELGRIKVRCEAIAGDDEEIDEWIQPLFSNAGAGASVFILPDPGDAVEIEYVTGSTLDSSYGQSFMSNPRLRWKAGVNREKADIPEEFRGANYGKRAGIRVGKNPNMVAFDKEKDEAALKGAKKTRIGTLTGGQPAVVGTDLIAWQTKMLEEAIERQKDQAASWSLLVGKLDLYFAALQLWIISEGGPDLSVLTHEISNTFEFLADAMHGDPDDYVSKIEASIDTVTDHLSSAVTIARDQGD
jgi:hypothetical protein